MKIWVTLGSLLTFVFHCFFPVSPPSSRNPIFSDSTFLSFLPPFCLLSYSSNPKPIEDIWVVWWFRERHLHPAKSGNHPLPLFVILVRKHIILSPILDASSPFPIYFRLPRYLYILYPNISRRLPSAITFASPFHLSPLSFHRLLSP